MGRQKSLRELEQEQQNLEYSGQKLKVFIADVLPLEMRDEKDMKDMMEETQNLVETYGGVVILKHVQKKSTPDYETYIGGGKLDEIIVEMAEMGANLLIIGNELKSKQIYEINERLKTIGAKAWDRIDLILKIFERHAKSKEAKLQIELASIKHMGPRIFDMGMELGKQGGKGKGETNTEIMKRHLGRIEKKIRDDLDKYAKVRAEHRKSRTRKGLNTIGVVGYTNAGKSTLTNALTSKGVLAEDKLFATLGTSVGKMWMPMHEDDYIGQEFLVSDTIGFIRDLPPELIEAFTSTLEDSVESQMLIHAIDAGDPKIHEKIKVVEQILDKIGADQPRINVFNKIDKIKGKKKTITNDEGEEVEMDYLEYLKQEFAHMNPVFISAYKGINLDDLKEEIKRTYNTL